jgi:hypothetical protein
MVELGYLESSDISLHYCRSQYSQGYENVKEPRTCTSAFASQCKKPLLTQRPCHSQGAATQKALAKARAMLRGWAGPAAAPPQPAVTGPPPPHLDAVLHPLSPNLLLKGEAALSPVPASSSKDERACHRWGQNAVEGGGKETPGSGGHVPPEELRFSCEGPETQLALARGRAMVRNWTVGPLSGEGPGAEGGVRSEEGLQGEGGGGNSGGRGTQLEETGGGKLEMGGDDEVGKSPGGGDEGEGEGNGGGGDGAQAREERNGEREMQHEGGGLEGGVGRGLEEDAERLGAGRACGAEQEGDVAARACAKGHEGAVAGRACAKGHESDVAGRACETGEKEAAHGDKTIAQPHEASCLVVGERSTGGEGLVDGATGHDEQGGEGQQGMEDGPGAVQMSGASELDAGRFSQREAGNRSAPSRCNGGEQLVGRELEGDGMLTSAPPVRLPTGGVRNGDGRPAEGGQADAGAGREECESPAKAPPEGGGSGVSEKVRSPDIGPGAFWSPEGGFQIGSTAPPSSEKRPCASWRVSETQCPEASPGQIEASGGLVSPHRQNLKHREGSKEMGVGATLVEDAERGVQESIRKTEERAAEGLGRGLILNGWRQKVPEVGAPKNVGRAPDREEERPNVPKAVPADQEQSREQGSPRPTEVGEGGGVPRGSLGGDDWQQCLEYLKQQAAMGRTCTLPAYSPGGLKPEGGEKVSSEGGRKTEGWEKVSPRGKSEPSPKKGSWTGGGPSPCKEAPVLSGEKAHGKPEKKGVYEPGEGKSGARVVGKEELKGGSEETQSAAVDDSVGRGGRGAETLQGDKERGGANGDWENQDARLKSFQEGQEMTPSPVIGETAGRSWEGKVPKKTESSAVARDAVPPRGQGLQQGCSQSVPPWPEICSIIGSEELPLFKPKPRVVYSAAQHMAAVQIELRTGEREEEKEVGGGGERVVETQESMGVLIWQRRAGVKRARTFVIESASEGPLEEGRPVHTKAQTGETITGEAGREVVRKRLRKVGADVLDEIEEEATWHEPGGAKEGAAQTGIEQLANRWFGGWMTVS